MASPGESTAISHDSHALVCGESPNEPIIGAVATGQLQVVDVMSAELDELTRMLTDAIHEHLDELDDDLRVMTAQSVRANLGLIVVMLREGSAPASAVAPEEARAYVREYVRRGLGTQVLQRAYRTAQAALSHLVLNRLRVLTDDPDDLVTLAGDFSDFLFGWVEELERQILAVYLREREDWLRGARAQRASLVRSNRTSWRKPLRCSTRPP